MTTWTRELSTGTSTTTAASLTIGDVKLDGTSNIGHVNDTDLMSLSSGALTVKGTLTIGIDDAGHDVKFFGDTASNYMLWDTSEDRLHIVGTDASNNMMRIESTDATADNSPDIDFYRNSASPADNDYLGVLKFSGNDSAGNKHEYCKIIGRAVDITSGSEESLLYFSVTEYDGQNTNGLTIQGSSSVDGKVDVTIPNGGLAVGSNSSKQGTLSLWDGSGGNTPGYLVLYSPNGTANYIFCEDDGTLKRHTSAPTANSDGSEIGGQS
tara:strand:+ start:3977 stop:4777 length:801 start_codon:yes stop_codon:yes gene_type:complete